VLGVKRALRKADVYKLGPREKMTDQYGLRTVAAVQKFQRQEELPTDGIYGPRTHRKLMRDFDAYGALLMSRAPNPDTSTTMRQRVLAEALWGYNNNWRIGYAQVRPMRSLFSGHDLPQTMDCSEFVTLCYKRAGAPDPNGELYSGYGYTGTLSQRGLFVAYSQARIGDLVFYGGGWPWHHVALYAGFGKVVSHGSDSGPHLCYIDYRGDRGAIRSYLP
jgi:hypothetical protein